MLWPIKREWKCLTSFPGRNFKSQGWRRPFTYLGIYSAVRKS